MTMITEKVRDTAVVAAGSFTAVGGYLDLIQTGVAITAGLVTIIYTTMLGYGLVRKWRLEDAERQKETG